MPVTREWPYCVGSGHECIHEHAHTQSWVTSRCQRVKEPRSRLLVTCIDRRWQPPAAPQLKSHTVLLTQDCTVGVTVLFASLDSCLAAARFAWAHSRTVRRVMMTSLASCGGHVLPCTSSAGHSQDARPIGLLPLSRVVDATWTIAESTASIRTWSRLAFIWRERERSLHVSPFVFKGKLHSLLCFKGEILRLSPNRQSKRKFLAPSRANDRRGAPPPSSAATTHHPGPWPHPARDKPSPAGRQAQLPGPGSRRPSSHPPSQVARLPSARLEARLLDLLPQARHL